jgi:hypothetical protein
MRIITKKRRGFVEIRSEDGVVLRSKSSKCLRMASQKMICVYRPDRGGVMTSKDEQLDLTDGQVLKSRVYDTIVFIRIVLGEIGF